MNWAALWAGKHSKTGSFSGSRTGPKRGSISRGLVLNLEGARLPKSDWSNSGLAKARFARTDLSRANLTNASLCEADLREAILHGANLLGASLEGADLRGADLTGALNLTRAQIESAITDKTTVLPPDLK
jgi:uncharacterized protein YjbI with pentapeptide repeats